MRLRDRNRIPYELTETRLSTVSPNSNKEKDAFPFYIEFANAHLNNYRTVRLRAENQPEGDYVHVEIDKKGYRIGCREFSRDTFRIIWRAMKTGVIPKEKA